MMRLMNCVCGHPDQDHVLGGRCRIPDCPCERFQPGDTLAWSTRPAEAASSRLRPSSRISM